MKKSFTPFIFIVFSCSIFMSCTKDVKQPAKNSNTSKAIVTNTNTTTQNDTNPGHTCGGHSSGNSSGSGF